MGPVHQLVLCFTFPLSLEGSRGCNTAVSQNRVKCIIYAAVLLLFCIKYKQHVTGKPTRTRAVTVFYTVVGPLSLSRPW